MVRTSHIRLAVITFCLTVAAVSASAAWKEKVLYSFQGGNDGYSPAGGVVFDKTGNLYGANTWGGDSNCLGDGCGTVFQVSPPVQKGGPWTETVIHAFHGINGQGDGRNPLGGLTIDQSGNLYGTTSTGGTGPCVLLGSHVGCGTVYEFSPPTQKGGQWTETILYNFQGGNDGYFPQGNLTFDKAGNLYGVTWFGGGKGDSCNAFYGGNCGTVFKLSPPKKKDGTWTEKVLYSFPGGIAGQPKGDGGQPNGGMVLDSKGALYGTTYYGGNEAGSCDGGSAGVGCGTVFRITPPSKKGGAWTEKVLHRFDIQDGVYPKAGWSSMGREIFIAQRVADHRVDTGWFLRYGRLQGSLTLGRRLYCISSRTEVTEHTQALGSLLICMEICTVPQRKAAATETSSA